jgi:uncharacterized membrane protein YeaQ/YmgE (transglycosylase-associated protein family)
VFATVVAARLRKGVTASEIVRRLENTPHAEEGNIVSILAWILVGLIGGIIARVIVPGAVPGGGGIVGLVVTIVLGIVGAMLGGFLAVSLGISNGVDDFDLGTILLSIVGTALILLVYRMVAGRGGLKI